ncbi:MAG: hypothetical protein EAZ70_07955 [Runella slithyformis]|jgi:ABC-type amino acid transport system permease subunit|nr:MAG: hypothetical protein EAZ70_07955 [Runella slithyformis]TAF80994.1 MAG: hypothetical protein EAZ50_07445 [Runella slithyformis]TAG23348.1 MAG: hypothetical protein EAZ38_03480 [Cytophagales bacterium]TAG40952.1 MAG: hypothetical protein EAZ32_04635 [Cytophagia bacterium]
MRKDLFFYVLLAVLTLVDAWLLAHPNLVGKLGILFFKYDMIKTLPRAFGTVTLVVLSCLSVGYVLQKQLSSGQSKWVLAFLVLACLGLLVQTYFKFSAGSYALTGAAFRTGAVLLPAIMALVFGKMWYGLFFQAPQ